MQYELIFIIVGFLFSYLILTWISHYDDMMFGSIIPDWLCIFCLIKVIKGG